MSTTDKPLMKVVVKFLGGIFEKDGGYCRSVKFIYPYYKDCCSYGMIWFKTLEEILSIDLGYICYD